jgi:hypothetical protein
LFGASVFNRRGWTYSQALSMSFCLVYFGSFLWELPTHIYTVIVRGGIDGAFPLHLLFIFPMIFIYEKVKTNQSRKRIAITLLEILGYSTLLLIVLLIANFNVWNVSQNPASAQGIEQSLWMINRMVVMVGLFSIYAESSLRQGIKVKREQVTRKQDDDRRRAVCLIILFFPAIIFLWCIGWSLYWTGHCMKQETHVHSNHIESTLLEPVVEND